MAAKGEPATPPESVLDSVPWVVELSSRPGIVRVGTTSVLEPGATGAAQANGVIEATDPDHLFLSLRRQGLLRDLRFLWDPESRQYHVILALGSDVAGHPRITHGGLTAATIDETTGCLVLESKRAGLLPPGMAFTAHLEVDYKSPLPTNVVVLCSASIGEVERRKIWTTAVMRDGPDGTIFGTGKALYVTVKDDAPVASDKWAPSA